MYTDEQIPRDLEHYVQEAHRMRREYLAALVRDACVAIARGVRALVQPKAPGKIPTGAPVAGPR